MAGSLGFELLGVPRDPPPPKTLCGPLRLVGPCFGGALGLSLVSFMDNAELDQSSFSDINGCCEKKYISQTCTKVCLFERENKQY